MEFEDRQTKLYLDLWTWMSSHKKHVLWGALALVLLGVWAGYFFWHRGQKEVVANEALSKVVYHTLVGGEVRVQSAEALVKMADEHPDTSAAQRALLLAGGRYFRDGKFADAKTQFDKYLRAYPGSPFTSQALFGTAVAAEAQGKTNDAITAYKNIADRYSSDNVAPQAKLALGRLYEAQGNLTQARDLFLQLERPEFGLVGSQASFQLKELFEKHPELIPVQPPPILPSMGQSPPPGQSPPGQPAPAPAPSSSNAPILNFNRP